MNSLVLRNNTVNLPIFCPDATKGVLRSCSSQDIKNAGVEGIVVNTYHLLTQPGIEVLQKFGGIKNFMSWDGLVISDSGGWQIFSLIQKNPNLGYINKDGVTFIKQEKDGRKKYKITPEECIKIQFAINADIMICLDYFTPPSPSPKELDLSVKLTIEWAQRCKEEFDRICKQKELNESSRPLLFCVLQGGRNKKAVEKCAQGLEKLNFDGWGLGGWLFDETGKLDLDICKFYFSCMEKEKPKYALGIGDPKSLVDCALMGFDIFDCVLPTRDARHKRIYEFKKPPAKINIKNDENWWGYYQINRQKYSSDLSPLGNFCDCFTCKNYSKAYVKHLFEINDTLAYRLCSIHNLYFYSQVIKLIREQRFSSLG